jgi:hypothetical protein
MGEYTVELVGLLIDKMGELETVVAEKLKSSRAKIPSLPPSFESVHFIHNVEPFGQIRLTVFVKDARFEVKFPSIPTALVVVVLISFIFSPVTGVHVDVLFIAVASVL